MRTFNAKSILTQTALLALSPLLGVSAQQPQPTPSQPPPEGATGGASISPYFRSGQGNFQLKQFDAAIVEFKQAEKDTPNDPMVHYYLGTSEEQVGKLDDAVDQFTKAQSLAKPGTQVYQYATAALASARQYARDPRYKKKPTGKDQSTLSPDAAARDAASKQLAQAERRAQDIEAHAEEEARRMSVATIRIGNMTVKRYTNEDLDEVRLEARDKAEGIRREAHQRYQSISATAPASSSITSPPGTRATITSPNRTAATAAGMSHPATQANQKPH